MPKLKLNKITISNLTPEESMDVKGGRNTTEKMCDFQPDTGSGPLTTAITITITLTTGLTVTCNTWQPTTRLTDNPGTQDSCGLCSTQYRC